MARLPHEYEEDFQLKLNRWLGREDRQIALELPHALYTMELMLEAGVGAEEALLYVAEGDYGPISKYFKSAIAANREGHMMLCDGLMILSRASSSKPFKEAIRELVDGMATGWDIGTRLGQFAYRNQLYIRRANDAFSLKFREIYLQAYLMMALCIPFVMIAIEIITRPSEYRIIFPPESYYLFSMLGIAIALYIASRSPPLDRTGMVELYMFMMRNPRTIAILILNFLVAGLLMMVLIGMITLFGLFSPITTVLLSAPGLAILVMLTLDYVGNDEAEKLESKFRQGLQDASGYMANHHALEWSVYEGFSKEFLVDLGVARDKWELSQGFRGLAKRYPLRTFKLTAKLITAATEKGLDSEDSMRMLADGLWEHHLIRFRRRTQNFRELIYTFIILIGIMSFLPLEPLMQVSAYVGYILIYMVGMGRL